MTSNEELQAALLGVPGVVGAVVGDDVSGHPRVRIWTDSTHDPADVESAVRALVGRAMALRRYEARPAVIPESDAAARDEQESPGPPRRTGLGRGLDALLPQARREPPPGHLVAIDLSVQPTLDMIAIEESAAGVTVRAVDNGGRVAEAKVIGGASSVNPAIVAAVAELRGELTAPRLVSVELRDTEVASVLVVTLELADGTIAAGAAVVQGGMPFTLGKASWAALQSRS